MQVQESLLIFAIVALVMWLMKSPPSTATVKTNTNTKVTMTAGRVTCKDCGKTWVNRDAFDEDKGCDRGWCNNTEEAILSRRKGRAGKDKPPHIEPKTAMVLVENPNPKIQQHITTSQVLSLWDKEEPLVELIVDDALNINLFFRRG